MTPEDRDFMEALTGRRRNELAQHITGQVGAVTGRVAALEEVVKQLAAGKTSIDMAAVQKAVELGVADAIESIDTTVRIDTNPA